MTSAPRVRTARARKHRRTVAAGLAASMVLHGVVLAGKTPAPPARQVEAEPDRAEPVRFATPALELVRMEVETPVKPVLQEVKAVAEPAAEEPSAEPAGRARPRQVALSMRPDFTAVHAATAFALAPLVLPQRAAEAPSDDEDEGRSFWARLGISTGRGGGACPIPRTPDGRRAN